MVDPVFVRRLLLMAGAVSCASPAALAQTSSASPADPSSGLLSDWPVSLLCPFGVGGNNDIAVRTLARIVRRNPGRTVSVLEANRPGWGCRGFVWLPDRENSLR
jgi:tripartite-type tricarboxylate transporter receptor subunit TctC